LRLQGGLPRPLRRSGQGVGRPGRGPLARPYWDIDCGFAAMAILLTAVDEGLGALFFGIFDGLAALREAFGIPPEWHPIGAVALGWPAPDEPSPSLRRGRRPEGETIHRGRW